MVRAFFSLFGYRRRVRNDSAEAEDDFFGLTSRLSHDMMRGALGGLGWLSCRCCFERAGFSASLRPFKLCGVGKLPSGVLPLGTDLNSRLFTCRRQKVGSVKMAKMTLKIRRLGTDARQINALTKALASIFYKFADDLRRQRFIWEIAGTISFLASLING
jgi:hypothetical protein